MADFGAPVAQNVNPVGQGLQSLSQILNIQQQRQALQTNAIQQQELQAQTQQEQQTASQRSGIANFMQNFDPTKHVGSDGTLDLDSVLTDPKLRAAAGDQFPELVQQLVAVKSAQLGAKQQLANLNGTLRDQFSSTVGSLRTDPDVVADNAQGRAKVQQAMGNLAETGGPDAARVANTYAGVVNHVPPGKLTQALSNFQLQAMDASTQAAKQAPGGFVDAGSAIQQTNPQAAGGNLGAQGPLPKDIAPQITHGPGDIPYVVPGGAKGALTSPGSSGPVLPTSQDWENFGGYQSNLNSRVAIASDSIPRIQAAEKALDSIRSGAGASTYANWAKKLQAVGAPQSLVDAVGNGNLAGAQEAEKYLFQTTFSGLRQAMQGDPARVAEFQSAEQVFPSIGTDPRAAKAVLGFMVDQSKRDYAEQQALNTARKNGSFNPATWQGDYQQQLRAGKVPGVPSSQVPSGGPQEGAKALSKSGRPIAYHNGQWEYQ